MHSRESHYLFKGAVPVFIAAAFWGVSYFVRKLAAGNISSFAIVFVYSSAAALFLYAVSPRQFRGFRHRFLSHWKQLIAMSLISATFGGLLVNVGLQYIDLGIACLLGRTEVVFTVLLAGIFLGEKLNRLSLGLGLIGMLSSAFLMPANYGLAVQMEWKTFAGILCILGAAFLWGISNILGRKLVSMHLRPLDMAMIRSLTGLVTTLPFVLIFEPALLETLHSWRILGMLAFGGVIGSGAAFILYYHGLKIVSAGASSLIEMSTPITAIILGIVFLDEQIDLLQASAATVMMVSLTAMVWIESKKHPDLLTANDVELV